MPSSNVGRDGEQASEQVRMLDRERVFDGFFQIDAYHIQHEIGQGDWTRPLERLVFERGDSVAVLPFDPTRREVVLFRQFRLPAYLREGQGWLWEMIAGMLDEGMAPEAMARQEALEEAGYALGPLVHVATVYPSVGACSERIHIYLAPVDTTLRVGEGGGLAEHGEHIQVSVFEMDEALRMAGDGRLQDAKAIIALQHLQLHWDELAPARADAGE